MKKVSTAAFIFLCLCGCRGKPAPSPEKPAEKAPKQDQYKSYLSSLEKEIEKIAHKCNYKLGCYWERGYDYIELKACKDPSAHSIFRTYKECSKRSLDLLEDLISKLRLKDDRYRWRFSSRRRRSYSGGGSSSSGGSDSGGSGGNGGNGGSGSGGSILGSLTREMFDRICGQPGAGCGSVTYDDLRDNPPAGRRICLSQYDAIRSLLTTSIDCSDFVQPEDRPARIETETGACPTDRDGILSIPRGNKLVTITLYFSPTDPDEDPLYYWKAGFIDSAGGTEKASDAGSSSPEQYILRAIDNRGDFDIYFDEDLIPNFDKTKTWLLIYTDPIQAVTLTPHAEYTAGGVDYQQFRVSGGTSTSRDGHYYVAYEDGGNCHYLLPPAE